MNQRKRDKILDDIKELVTDEKILQEENETLRDLKTFSKFHSEMMSRFHSEYIDLDKPHRKHENVIDFIEEFTNDYFKYPYERPIMPEKIYVEVLEDIFDYDDEIAFKKGEKYTAWANTTSRQYILKVDDIQMPIGEYASDQEVIIYYKDKLKLDGISQNGFAF